MSSMYKQGDPLSRDRLSEEHRSWNMSRIKSKNTSPELKVRKMLHSMGYRFRLHGKNLAGKPDIVMKKHKTAIFVHGCFWHRHKNCNDCTTPTANREFWRKKFESNVLRDSKTQKILRKLGWKVFVIWQCETKDQHKLKEKLSSLMDSIRKDLSP